MINGQYNENILENRPEDRNDARGIAAALRGGLYREVHLKSQVHVDVCSLITARKTLVNQRTNLKNTRDARTRLCLTPR